ncbi:selenide, water dikinase SelD [Leptolyngbya sp. FACHB-16]|uniref:selenide, water dikinase SelD n=1 Tax=Leptolyngbya sp. FACHB-16 TaxID=2692800 RepID=UPI00321F8733
MPLFQVVEVVGRDMQGSSVAGKDLVLVGGGHSHAIALKSFGMQPLDGVRVTLITDVMHTPYSGMLPGYLAGLYSFDECHIDLQRLATFAGVRLIHARAIALDLVNNQVLCEHHPPVSFDLLSLDIGSTPAVSTVPGAEKFAIPAKPISKFLDYWDRLVAEVEQNPQRPLRVGVVGGGAGGVELSLAVQAHLQRIYREAGQPDRLESHLFQRSPELLPERGRWARRKMRQVMEQRGIALHLGETVEEVGEDWVRCASGLEVECDRLFWVTQAAATPWIREAGLATDERGFLLVNDRLQSISHPQVFGAGDVATMQAHPRPKAGVFAVRQGKPLTENLRRALENQPLKPFVPQKQFLILIGVGDETAVASRGALGIGPAKWIWQWKDRIDRKFMDKFSDLKSMSDSAPESADTLEPAMRCAGCGSKVGSSILENVLTRIRQEQRHLEDSNILLGLESSDDAAVLQVPPGQVLVQTVDYFRALVSDPYLFGQIAAHHALSDLFAMGAKPQSALAIATLPYAPDQKVQDQLYHLLTGATEVLHEAGAALVGGHTTEGPELAFGLTCNGLAESDRLLRKGGLHPGQALILTKPLGTGTLFAADMQLKAKGRWIEGAIASMLTSNQAAAQCFLDYGATACTDITGFGLLGHLLEMMRASQVSVTLDMNAIPVLGGAQETLQRGIFSSLQGQNRKVEGAIANLSEAMAHPLFPILFDPQTSGGLLAGVEGDRAQSCLAALHQQGYSDSQLIGYVTESATNFTVTLSQ